MLATSTELATRRYIIGRVAIDWPNLDLITDYAIDTSAPHVFAQILKNAPCDTYGSVMSVIIRDRHASVGRWSLHVSSGAADVGIWFAFYPANGCAHRDHTDVVPIAAFVDFLAGAPLDPLTDYIATSDRPEQLRLIVGRLRNALLTRLQNAGHLSNGVLSAGAGRECMY